MGGDRCVCFVAWPGAIPAGFHVVFVGAVFSPGDHASDHGGGRAGCHNDRDVFDCGGHNKIFDHADHF